jgi:uncharacterized protein YwbE
MAMRMGPRLQVTLDLPDATARAARAAAAAAAAGGKRHPHGLEPQVEGGRIDRARGLAQVRERVATAYDGRGRVELQSAPGQGTVIRIHLPAPNPAT